VLLLWNHAPVVNASEFVVNGHDSRTYAVLATHDEIFALALSECYKDAETGDSVSRVWSFSSCVFRVHMQGARRFDFKERLLAFLRETDEFQAR
jgi:hypothetical protein